LALSVGGDETRPDFGLNVRRRWLPAFFSVFDQQVRVAGSEALRGKLLDSKIRVIYLSPRTTATVMNGPDVREMQKRIRIRVHQPQIVAKMIIRHLPIVSSLVRLTVMEMQKLAV
jgi:hypothetical protein